MGNEKEKAFLVSVCQDRREQELSQGHVEELAALAETFEMEVVEKTVCFVRTISPATFVSRGKLQELVEGARMSGATVVVFDDEIAPAQQRNLEKSFGLPVIDRTEVILGVFALHAQTKEARLQVSLAEARYQFPRLKKLWTHLSRQKVSGKGGGFLKGEGEKQIEIDRQILKRRVAKLEREIREIKETRKVQRAARMKQGVPTFAIIGYTNAGKSTLFNVLTDAEVLVEDKLFATLDTTTRKFTLPNKQKILFIDTVGFVRKLPHLLVAAFRSTLEESLEADILIHLLDVSHPLAEEQLTTTMEVLKELGAKDKPILTVFNKTDLCSDHSLVEKLRLQHPKTVAISALKKEGIEELQELLMRELVHWCEDTKLRIPQSEYALVSEVKEAGNVTEVEYEGNDVIVSAHLPPPLAEKLKEYKVPS